MLHFTFSFSVCSKGHLLKKGRARRYYNCIKCRRYNICQSSFYCNSCKQDGCFACYEKENDEEVGKKDLDYSTNVVLS